MSFILKLQDKPTKSIGKLTGKPLYFVDICSNEGFWEFDLPKARRFITSKEAFNMAARDNACKGKRFVDCKVTIVDETDGSEVVINQRDMDAVLTEWRVQIEADRPMSKLRDKEHSGGSDSQGCGPDEVPVIPSRTIDRTMDIHDEIAGFTECSVSSFSGGVIFDTEDEE